MIENSAARQKFTAYLLVFNLNINRFFLYPNKRGTEIKPIGIIPNGPLQNQAKPISGEGSSFVLSEEIQNDCWAFTRTTAAWPV